MALRSEARSDQGVAAVCLLALFGHEEGELEGDAALARRYVGALLMDDTRRDLSVIRKALTTER